MANSEQNDLEKLLKDNLSDKTASVPDFVWDNIEEELFPKKKRRGLFWLFFAGLGLLAGATAIYFMASRSTGKPDVQFSKHETGQMTPSSWNTTTQDTKTLETRSEKGTSGGASENTSAAHVSAGNGTPSIQNNASPASTFTGSKAEHRANRSRNAVSGRKNEFTATATSSGGQHAKLGSEGQMNSGAANQVADEKQDPKNSTHAVSGGNTNTGEVKNGSGEPAQKDSSAAQPLAQTSPKDSVHQTQTESRVAEIQADTTQPESKPKRFMISVYGGASLYDMAVFKDYFTSGQLSNRPFKSSGFEVGAGFGYQITRKLGIYANAAFNQKNTSFEYSLAITESDYFNHLLQGELLPLENIIDNGVGNCFLVEGVRAKYQVNSWLLSLGSTYDFLYWKKISVGADIRFTANMSSALQMKELAVLQIQPYGDEHFKSLKIGAGLNIGYQVTESFSVGIAPMYHLQLNQDKKSFYKGLGKELVLPVRLGFCF